MTRRFEFITPYAKTPRFYIHEAYRRMTHIAAGPVFWQRMRPAA